MTTEQSTILCPNCGAEINVSDVLHQQVEQQLKQQYTEHFAERQRELEIIRKDLEKQQQDLKEREEHQQEDVEAAIAAGLSKKKAELQKDLREQVSRVSPLADHQPD